MSKTPKQSIDDHGVEDQNRSIVVGLMFSRPVSLFEGSLVETDIALSGRKVKAASQALWASVLVSERHKELPRGITIDVREIENLKTHEVGAAIVISRLDETIPPEKFLGLVERECAYWAPLIKQTLSRRGSNPKQRELLDTQIAEQPAYEDISRAFNDNLREAGEVTIVDPASAEQTSITIVASAKERPQILGEPTELLRGIVVGFSPNGDAFNFKIDGESLIEIDYMPQQQESELLLLRYTRASCVIKVGVAGYLHSSSAIVKRKFTLLNIINVLEQDWKGFLTMLDSAANRLQSMSLPPDKWEKKPTNPKR